VLLHGFPSSSYEFHNLIPRLASHFRLIAPDYPGMGFSDAPTSNILSPTFDDVAGVVDAFITQYVPGTLILYMHDFGGPIGMRIATAHPERIAGLIFQNTTVSLEGWNSARLKFYEELGGPETPDKLAEAERLATVERDRFLHQSGARHREALDPTDWASDAYAFTREVDRVFMSRMLTNMSANFQHYPEWNAYLRDRQPKTLVVWGRNDPFLETTAAEAIKQDVPAARLRYFDGGHFVLDEYADAIADEIVEMFSQKDTTFSGEWASERGQSFEGEAEMSEPTVTSHTIPVEHIRIVSERPFAKVRQSLERMLPKYDTTIAVALRDGDEKRIKDYEENGPRLSIESEVDHGALLQTSGGKRNALLYQIGNPLTATSITRHQLSAALYAPLRVVLFEDERGRAVFEYDKPSSLFGQYGDERIAEVARHTDRALDTVLRDAAR
jgi:pimeloyl-ACP methyl ester carboxylesterase/uncharacterized protein (DUF302 family)